ncbi:hypothetical protein JCM16106_20130 [Hydrogenophilus islandicus]
MNVELFLSRLTEVEETGGGAWQARCPACGANLHLQDFKEVFYCDGGCDPWDIMEALGLSWDDLYGNRPPRGGPK